MSEDPDRRCIAVWVTLNDGDEPYVQVERMSPLPWPLVARVLYDASAAIEMKLEEARESSVPDDE